MRNHPKKKKKVDAPTVSSICYNLTFADIKYLNLNDIIEVNNQLTMLKYPTL